MADNNESKKPVYRRSLGLRPGQPMEVIDDSEALADRREPSPLCHAMVETLVAYRKAFRGLLDGQYASVRELAPPQMRVPCHIYVVCCPDGVLVRYDAAGEEQPKMRFTERDEMLAEMAPAFSEQMIHVPDDPLTYVPEHMGPALIQAIVNEHGEVVRELASVHPIIYASKISSDVKLAPSERPPCLASLNRELLIELHGVVLPSNVPAKAIPATPDRFVAHGVVPLPVGWQAIELYPRLGEECWRPEYGTVWAQLDLLCAVAQRNAIKSALHRLDGRRAAREYYARLLEQFEALLAGPEEPCHQFLKEHPHLLCATYDAVWSKVRFGERVSDFVFREPCNDYLLTEIEAPHREIFRKDGHPRQALTHAMGQIDDWLAHIQENRAKVERELELDGISAVPRALVVIGRSASLTDENRRKLAVMQGQRPRLSIMTYDDVIDRARANLERHFGPLSFRAENLEVYFYRDDPAPERLC